MVLISCITQFSHSFPSLDRFMIRCTSLLENEKCFKEPSTQLALELNFSFDFSYIFSPLAIDFLFIKSSWIIWVTQFRSQGLGYFFLYIQQLHLTKVRWGKYRENLSLQHCCWVQNYYFSAWLCTFSRYFNWLNLMNLILFDDNSTQMALLLLVKNNF